MKSRKITNKRVIKRGGAGMLEAISSLLIYPVTNSKNKRLNPKPETAKTPNNINNWIEVKPIDNREVHSFTVIPKNGEFQTEEITTSTPAEKQAKKQALEKKIAEKKRKESEQQKYNKEKEALGKNKALKRQIAKKKKIAEEKIKNEEITKNIEKNIKDKIKKIKTAKFYLEIEPATNIIYNRNNFDKLENFYKEELDVNNEHKSRILREIDDLRKETYKIGPRGKKYEEWLNGDLVLPIKARIEFIEDLIVQINTLIYFNNHGSVRALSSAINTISGAVKAFSRIRSQIEYSEPITQEFERNSNERETILKDSLGVLLIIKDDLEEKNIILDLKSKCKLDYNNTK